MTADVLRADQVRSGGDAGADRQQASTTILMVPTMFVRMMKLPPDKSAKYDVMSSLRWVTTGAPCPEDVKRSR